jgi:hypothetical protein
MLISVVNNFGNNVEISATSFEIKTEKTGKFTLHFCDTFGRHMRRVTLVSIIDMRRLSRPPPIPFPFCAGGVQYHLNWLSVLPPYNSGGGGVK